MNGENCGGQSFENFLRERIKNDGFNLKKLSEQSGIAIKHLEAMTSGNFEKLPAAPYFRGYVRQLGRILDFDADEWWGEIKKSGATDGGEHKRVAEKRFIKRNIPKIAWLSVILLALIIYGGARYSNIFGKPVLTLTYPQQNPATVSESQIVLAGIVKNGSELYVNGESVPLGTNGEWQKSVLLQSGINSLEITAKKTLGGETKILEQIIYAPAQPAAPPSGTGSNL